MSSNLVELGEIADFVNGVAFKPDDWVDSGLPIIRIQNLNDLTKPFNFTTRKVKDDNLAFKGDLLVAWSASLGVYEWVGEKACINQHIFKVKPNSDKVDKNYLKRALEVSIIAMEKQVHGAVMKHITRDKFLSIQIPLPPLSEQKRIADILDKADELRQKRQQSIAKLDELLQATFIDMFGDPVTNPKGWEIQPLKNLMTIVRGGSPRPIDDFLGGDYPWIKIGDATKGDDLYISKTKESIIEAGLKKTRLLPEGSLIFANCGVSLGFARILKIQGCIHDGWLAFQDIDETKINKIFLLKALNSVTQYFRDTAPDGTQPNLNTEIMKNFKLILPPIQEQNKFEKIVYSVNQQKNFLTQQLTQQNQLFQSLQQQAFNGTL